MALFTKPSIDEVEALIIAGFNKINGIQTGPGSRAREEIKSIARALLDAFEYLDVIALNITPETATLPGLEIWGSLLGLPRKGGTKASRDQSLLITGMSPGGVPIPLGTILQNTSLVKFETLAVVATPVGTPFQVKADIQAVEAGTVANLPAGTNLTFITPIVGVKETATIILDLTNGTDEETEGLWRERLVQAFREKLGGGRRSDYELWAREVDWVDRVWIYPQKPSSNSVGVTAVKAATGAALLPTTVERDELLAHIDGKKPVSDDLQWISIEDVGSDPGLVRIQSETTVTLRSGLEPDWSRPVSGITLASFVAATNEVTTNETLPDNFQAGDLLTLVTADVAQLEFATGKPTRVSAVTGPTTFVVQPIEGSTLPFDHTPVVGDEIWPSSDPMVSARERILNGVTVAGEDCPTPGLTPMNKLGPANPSQKYGSWISAIRQDEVSSLARNVDILDPVTLIVGSVDPLGLVPIEFPFPNFTKVQLLIPGQVWVHA